jgi:hypothetical protein
VVSEAPIFASATSTLDEELLALREVVWAPAILVAAVVRSVSLFAELVARVARDPFTTASAASRLLDEFERLLLEFV